MLGALKWPVSAQWQISVKTLINFGIHKQWGTL